MDLDYLSTSIRLSIPKINLSMLAILGLAARKENVSSVSIYYYIHIHSLPCKPLASCIGWLLDVSINNDYA
jgi:hypothetical protein